MCSVVFCIMFCFLCIVLFCVFVLFNLVVLYCCLGFFVCIVLCVVFCFVGFFVLCCFCCDFVLIFVFSFVLCIYFYKDFFSKKIILIWIFFFIMIQGQMYHPEILGFIHPQTIVKFKIQKTQDSSLKWCIQVIVCD